jgi:hypothetical protein
VGGQTFGELDRDGGVWLHSGKYASSRDCFAAASASSSRPWPTPTAKNPASPSTAAVHVPDVSALAAHYHRDVRRRPVAVAGEMHPQVVARRG